MIHIADNRRYFTNERGEPFFWLADTAWELFHRLTLTEADDYLSNRQALGFNVIQAVALPELDGLDNPNANGDPPLNVQRSEYKSIQPNEAYFRHIDAVIDLAAKKGLIIALLPTWGDKVFPLWASGPQIFTAENIFDYGKWIGARYADRSNIVWVNGGDRPESRDGADYTDVWRALAHGLRDSVGDKHLITYHPCGGHSSSMSFHDDEWLDFNMWQSGHSQQDAPIWEMIGRDYARHPVKPVIDGEPNYEDHPINPFTRQWSPEMGCFTEHDVRRQAYRAAFAGAAGHTYGHHSVWQFYSPGRAPINFPQMTWQQALNRPGASQMKHLATLLYSRPYFSRIPDPSLIASENGSGSSHVQACRDQNGSYAFVYVPQGNQTVVIDTANLNAGTIRASWFDPRTGLSEEFGRLDKQHWLEFTSPDSRPDSVLILDADG